MIATLNIDSSCILALPTKVICGSAEGKLITWDFVNTIIKDVDQLNVLSDGRIVTFSHHRFIMIDETMIESKSYIYFT